MRCAFLLLVCAAVRCAGHGGLTQPPPRSPNCTMENAGLAVTACSPWYTQGCSIGCAKCSGEMCNHTTKCCASPMEPTLAERDRTYPLRGSSPSVWYSPWMAPGFAPLNSSCGLAGGWYNTGEMGNGRNPPVGVAVGTDMGSLPAVAPTVWEAGSTAEAAWSLYSNHGGGYAYRLCPRSGNLTEACFQKRHLRFSGPQQWIQYGADKRNRTAIPAVRVTNGTFPEGSQWTRNPIPACSGPTGGHHNTCTGGPQFAPPIPGLYGFGLAGCWFDLPYNSPQLCSPQELAQTKALFNFNIVDLVEVPADMAPGEYVLSWRWDCEQTPQIWAGCSDVTIVAAGQRRA